MNTVRQGDVLLTPVAALPKGKRTPVARESGQIVLAHGEATGHLHAIAEPDAELIEVATADTVDRFLRLRSAGTLTHQEHGHIAVLPGTYRVTIHEEWSDAQEPRAVLD